MEKIVEEYLLALWWFWNQNAFSWKKTNFEQKCTVCVKRLNLECSINAFCTKLFFLIFFFLWLFGVYLFGIVCGVHLGWTHSSAVCHRKQFVRTALLCEKQKRREYKKMVDDKWRHSFFPCIFFFNMLHKYTQKYAWRSITLF